MYHWFSRAFCSLKPFLPCRQVRFPKMYRAAKTSFFCLPLSCHLSLHLLVIGDWWLFTYTRIAILFLLYLVSIQAINLWWIPILPDSRREKDRCLLFRLLLEHWKYCLLEYCLVLDSSSFGEKFVFSWDLKLEYFRTVTLCYSMMNKLHFKIKKIKKKNNRFIEE